MMATINVRIDDAIKMTADEVLKTSMSVRHRRSLRSISTSLKTKSFPLLHS
jgi:hypothetical protein